MNEEPEIIDSSKMEVLSEFPLEYENDEEITKPESAEKAELYICSLDKDIIIAYRSKRTGRRISEIVFEEQNILFVAESINKLLDKEKPWEESIKKENGKDDLLIYYSSSWANNLPAPFERINIQGFLIKIERSINTRQSKADLFEKRNVELESINHFAASMVANIFYEKALYQHRK